MACWNVILSPVLREAFRNTFVNLIAFLSLLNPPNKSDKKKYFEIGLLLILRQRQREQTKTIRSKLKVCFSNSFTKLFDKQNYLTKCVEFIFNFGSIWLWQN